MGVVISLEDGKHRDASVKPLVDKTRPDMDRVNQLILSKAGSNVALIPEVANHLITSGGKRLRPMLTLASATMFGYAGEAHVKLATSVEFMHTATLLHDDVVDESDLRRGRSTAPHDLGQPGQRAGGRLPARPVLQDDGGSRFARGAGRAVLRCRR